MLTGTYRFPPMKSVVYGRPFAEALREQVEAAGAHSVFLLASGTIGARNRHGRRGPPRARQPVGRRLREDRRAHAARRFVAAANAARAAGADLIATLGGGSVTDAAKMVAFCLGNDITDPAQLDDYRARVGADGTVTRPAAKPMRCARSRSRRRCRPANTRHRPAAPTPRAM